MGQDAARRADDDRHARQPLLLVLLGVAADDEPRRQPVEVAHHRQHLEDLLRQLPGRRRRAGEGFVDPRPGGFGMWPGWGGSGWGRETLPPKLS